MGQKGKRKKKREAFAIQPASIAFKIVSYACLAVGIASFWGISQFHHLDNTINGVGFFTLYAFLGILISSPIYVLIYRTVPDLKTGRKVASHWKANLVGLEMGLVFLTPAIACCINRKNPIDKEECKDYNVKKIGSSGRKPYEYYFFVEIQGAKERITATKTFWQKLEKGQSIRLCLQKGVLGYKYIRMID